MNSTSGNSSEAQQSPQAVDWRQRCLAFDEAMLTLQESDQTPLGQRLATAADAIEQMAFHRSSQKDLRPIPNLMPYHE